MPPSGNKGVESYFHNLLIIYSELIHIHMAFHII